MELVVGYSFRDQHVNELIGRWFNASNRRRIIVVDREASPRSPFAQGLAWFGPDRQDKGKVPSRFEHIVEAAARCPLVAQTPEMGAWRRAKCAYSVAYRLVSTGRISL